MINVLNIDNEIVMQLTEADIGRLLDVAKAAKALLRHESSPKWKDGLIPWREIAEGVNPDGLVVLADRLAAVEDLLDG